MSTPLTLPRRRLEAVRRAVRPLPWQYYVGYGIARLSGLVVLPIVSRTLGVSGLGRFEVALAAMMAATIVLDAGVGAAIVRFSRDDAFPRRDLIGAAAAVQVAAALVAAAVFIPVMAFTAPAQESLLALSAIVVAFSVVEGFAVLGAGMLRAELRDRTYLALSVSRLLLTATIGGIGAATFGVEGALLGVALGGAGFAGYALRRWLREARGRRAGSTEARRRISRYGIPLIATTMATWSLGLADRLFLQSAVSPAELGQYSANYRIGAVILTFLASPLGLAWMPVAQYATPERRRRLLRWWVIGFTAVCVPPALLLTVGSDALVGVIFGSEFHGDALVVGLVAAAGWLGGIYYLVATPLLVGDGTHQIAIAALLAVAAALALNAVLIPAYHGTGAAAATVAGYALLCVFTGAAAHRYARRPS